MKQNRFGQWAILRGDEFIEFYDDEFDAYAAATLHKETHMIVRVGYEKET